MIIYSAYVLFSLTIIINYGIWPFIGIFLLLWYFKTTLKCYGWLYKKNISGNHVFIADTGNNLGK